MCCFAFFMLLPPFPLLSFLVPSPELDGHPLGGKFVVLICEVLKMCLYVCDMGHLSMVNNCMRCMNAYQN